MESSPVASHRSDMFYLISNNMGRERDVAVIIILVQNWSLVRSTIFHPFPHRIILIIERKMCQLVNEIIFFTHWWAGDLLNSETKVVVDIDQDAACATEYVSNLFE